MQDIEIWPNGEIDFGTNIVDGKRIVAMRCVDGETGQVVVLAFNQATFTAFADHAAMVASTLLDDDRATRLPD